MEKGKWDLRLIAVVWGVYLLFFGIYLIYTRTPDYNSSKRTEGEVVDIRETIVHGERGSWAYRECPVVTYYVDTVKYEFINEKKSYLGLYNIGDKVTIIYNPWNPKEACILGIIGYWINITEIFAACFLLAILTLLATVIPDGYDDRFTAALTK